MKEIVDITVTQLRVYPLDSLPFAELRLSANIKTIKDAFHFENVQVEPFTSQIGFANGLFEHRGKSIHVVSTTIEQRRLVIQARGRSPMADSFYSALSGLLLSFRKRPRGNSLEPLLKAEETACVATMDIDFDELIAPTLFRFIQNETKAKLRTDWGIPRSIGFKNLSFEVKYGLANPELEEHDITLSNKLLTIEPRLATPIRERRFYTSSPTDSETHLALLEMLEKEILKARPKSK